MPKGRFYAVEMVRFAGEGLSAFEARGRWLKQRRLPLSFAIQT
jgi:hypothetical protein